MRKIPTANILIFNTKDNTVIFDESVILPIAPVDENKWTNEQLKAVPTETLDVIKALSDKALDAYLEAEIDIQDGLYDDPLFKASNQKAMKKVVDTYKQAIQNSTNLPVIISQFDAVDINATNPITAQVRLQTIFTAQ